MPNWKEINRATQISTRSLSLKTKLVALAEQREESLDTTVKAALEAGIVALTADKPSIVLEIQDNLTPALLRAAARMEEAAKGDPNA
ncbi:MAG TPA: hypothetical protein ENO16_06940 [Chromatiales bacterium]|nr:hypothetical protein [Chromatiales bacterium]